ncbi:Fe(2+) transporter permease subunit FeoB [Aquicella lusitana]|uniref:Ferrous iron transport protein B n=1 Tax=Aquicella lusitana TaxID=254246 RepID=A0A370GUL8_9COXI|nr:Fe(2+) transporter permease subunit FeoB [Aquicella lusitana]RDI46936.1 ferrous iron transport protein B [Aquicella lusitana]VVC73827.1 Ferrous iron transport protein B [Aquicella lusitana]
MPCCQSSSSCCAIQSGAAPKSKRSIALVGNPNCGKTTLFNALTGARQRVGNWPGVTVERKSGSFTEGTTLVEVVDLPGVYSLTLASESAAMDERIACEYLLEQHPNVIVNIVDASNLERHLYLTLQLLEMNAPVILVLNMMDVAQARGIQIDIAKLSHELGCPVVALEANKGNGLRELKRVITEYDPSSAEDRKSLAYPAMIQEAIADLSGALSADRMLYAQSLEQSANRWNAIRLLEDDVLVRQRASVDILKKAASHQAAIQQALGEEADILLADTRYRYIEQFIQSCVMRSAYTKTPWTTRIDNIVLNRILGVPIFLAVMYLLFLFSINIGGAFQDFFDISSQTIFVDGFAYALNSIGAPAWLTVLLANGIGKGINTTVTFIPVIGAMFLFLAMLEDSGYMARAAFVVDRLMRALQLPGKAFVPMIVGFGCNVPAVMGARTLENKRDRILTILMSPFMSCGARLAIFAVFTAAFFPSGGQNIVFALYLIGILMAVLTGFMLRKTLLKGDPAPLVMELPPYHVPHMKTLMLHAWQRLKGFVFRAGKLIVPICILIGALNSLNLDGTMNTGEGDAHSLLSLIGQWATPIFAPMGIHANNWPATVGLVTGILAKEVVVGTLNTLYTQMGHLAAASSADTFSLWAGLAEALRSIPENFAQLGNALSNPVLAKAPIDPVDKGVYGLMYQQFDGQIGAFAYLLFVLLYFPCISTTAAMLRELHRGWSLFSACWMTGVAYGTAVAFYQAATWMRHPLSSSIWIASLAAFFIGTIAAIRWYANRDHKYFSPTGTLATGRST